MANTFGFGPMGALPRGSQSQQGSPSEKPESKPDDIGAVAQRHRLPRNIVMALKEQGDDLETRAGQIARELDAGKSIKDVVPQTIRTRATAIADLIEKEEGRPKEANALRDFPAALGASVARAGGSIVRGVGEGISAAADLANQVVARPIAEGMTGGTPEVLQGKAPNVLAGAADFIGGDNGLAGTLDSFVSEEVKKDVADFIDPKADLFNPDSWKMGPRPTVRGAVYSSIDVFGSMAPVVVAGIYGGPGAAMSVGGAMGGGFAADEAGKVIDQMASEQLPDGRSRLEAESSVYQRLVASGMPADQAREITKRRASQFAALAASVPAALGGAATNAIVSGTVGAVARLPWAGRVGAAAGLSAVEEGAQEVAEGVSGRTAANIGAGINQPVTEGTLAEFTLGAIGGGAMGAVGGAFSRRQRDDQPNPAGDGSAGGQGAGPGSQLPGGPGPAPDISQAPPPVGPITRAAESAPDLTPQPEAEPLPPRFPDVKPGAQIVLQDPEDGRLINAVFMGEEDGVPMVRFPNAPDPVDIDPQLFNEMLDGARRAQEAEKAAGSKPGSKAPAKDAKPATRLSEAPLGPEADPVIDYFEERASVLEYDGGFTREEAEARAALATLSQIGRMSPEALSEPRIQQIEASLRRMVEGARTAGILPAEDVAQQPAAPAPAPAQEDRAAAVPDSAFNGDLEKVLTDVFDTDAGSVELSARGFTAEEVSALEKAGFATDGRMSREQFGLWMDERSLRLSGGRRKPKSPAPVVPPPMPQPPAGSDPAPVPGRSGSDPAPTADGQPNIASPSRVVGQDPVARAQRDMEQKRARLAEIEAGLTDDQRAIVKSVVDQAPEAERWAARRGALSAFAGETDPLLQPTSKDDARAFRAAQKAAQPLKNKRAVVNAIKQRGQKPEDFDIREVEGGFIGVRKAAVVQPEKQSPTGFDYPNRRLGLRYAKVGAPVDGIGDSSDGSLGNIALANAREGDVLPGVGTVAKVTDKQIQITGSDGKVKRISIDTDPFRSLGRDMGSLIASAANLSPDRLGSLMDMIERDPALTYKNGIPELFDDPALRGERGERPGRRSILKPLTGSEPEKAAPNTEAQTKGPFGPIIRGYEGNWKGAALELERRQTGEAPGALSHPEVGPIALVWGQEGTSSSDGMGLAKLIAWHPEVLDDLQGRLSEAEVVSRTEGRIQLRSKRDNFGIRLQFDGNNKTWLLTAFERGRQRTERSSSRLSEIWDGSFSPAPLTQDNNRTAGDADQDGSKPGRDGKTTGTPDAAQEGMSPPSQPGKREDGSAESGIQPPSSEQVDAAAAETDPNPSPAQAAAENYRTGKLDWQGLKLSIENRKGSTRKGYDADGNETWSVEMPAHYGRILRTEGADGDHVDFYMGEATDSETVWVIDQMDAETGRWDEHKVMLGFKNKRAAIKVYDAAFSDGSGPKRRGAVTEMPLAGFKDWLADAEKVKKPAGTVAEKADPQPARKSPKKAREERIAKLRDYFAPGNIVASYGGNDRVLSFEANADGDWSVTVESVVKDGETWVKNPADARVRTHRTAPDERKLAAGPIRRAVPDTASEKRTEPQRGAKTKADKRASAVPLAQIIRRRGGIATTRVDAKTGDRVPTWMAAELKHRGITPRSHPYLFNAKGEGDFDNIPPGTFSADDAVVFGLDDTGNYLNRDALLDALAAEVTGAGPTPLDLDADAAAREVQQAEIDREREENVARDVDDQVERLQVRLIPGEREAIIGRVALGESVREAVHDILVRSVMTGDWANEQAAMGRSPDGAEAAQIRSIPFGDEGDVGTEADEAGRASRPEAQDLQSGEAGRGGPARGYGQAAGEVASPSLEAGSDDASNEANPEDGRLPEWWARISREDDGREARDILERAQVGFGRIGRPWKDIRLADQEKILAARNELASSPKAKAWDGKTYPTTLEDVADKARDGRRLTHIYAEYGGGRYFLASVEGNPDAPAAEWKRTYPKASIYTTDRADGTSIDGQIAELEARLSAASGERSGAPAFEPGADGKPQAIMPGMEGSEAQAQKALTDRQRLEMEARQKQSKMRRLGGNDGDAGPLFGNGTDDLFAAKPAAPMTKEPPQADAIEEALSKIDKDGRGLEIANEFRRALVADRRDVEEWKKEKAKSGGDGSIYNDDIERAERRVADVEARILEEAAAIKAKTSPGEDAAVKPEASGPKPSDKIEDFGEKIGGARKDMWGSYTDRMKEAEQADIAAEPLSKSWPTPDYEKLIEQGVDPWTVSFIRAARDAVPRKPAKSWKQARWVESVKVLRGMANDLMSGKVAKDKLQDRIQGDRLLAKTLGGQVALYEAVGHSKSLQGLTLSSGSYSVFRGVAYNPAKVIWAVEREQKATAFGNMPRQLATGDTREEAIAAFKKVYGSIEDGPQRQRGGAKLSIYSRDKRETWVVGVKIGREHVDLRAGIKSVDEARRIIAEEEPQLQEQLDRMRNVRERKEENSPRVGADHRLGADVTPAQFEEAFGFRGVEFGEWVEGPRRQQDLNEAYDALMDLAGILDIPSRAISLNGSLGLAFGARGKGGKNPAAAHYEPGKVVINLTKRSGRGSLAHEWFHALDNYFAKKRQPQQGTYITDNNAPGGASTEGIRPEIIDAFRAVKRAIMATGLKERSSRIDRLRSSPYWGTGIEMHARAFESYVIAKLQDQSFSNDYLANIVNGVSWQMQAELSGLGDSYPYLKPEEIDQVRPAFDRLFAIMESRETDLGGGRTGVELFSRRSGESDTSFSARDAALFMVELAQVDGVFQNPRSAATSLEGVFADIEPTISYQGRLSEDDPRSKGKDADTVTLLSSAKGKPIYVMETAGEVWIDVSNLAKGDGGSRIYAAISDYAINTGKVFIGDPEGLSVDALRRRTDNMLSSALKHGTTRHIAPHEYQLRGDQKHGVPPLRWTEGDDLANLEALIEVSVANLTSLVPDVADARYDFASGTFRTGEGKPVTDDVVGEWSEASERNRAPSVARSSIKRGILLNTLARAESSQVSGLLERALRQQRQLVDRGGLRDILYRRADSTAEANAETASFIAALKRDLQRAWAKLDLPPNGLAIVDRLFGYDVDGKPVEVDGRYSRGVAQVALASMEGSTRTLHHEAVHFMWGSLTDQEKSVLARKAKSDWIGRYKIEQDYADFSPEIQVQEAVAAYFGDYATGGVKPESGVVARAMVKIARFIEVLGNALRGNGFVSADEVIEAMLSGDVGRRGQPEASAEMRGEPVARLTGDELGAWEDVQQLAKKAGAWYRENLVGQSVTMESTGWQVRFGRVGNKKISGRKGDVLLRSVPALRHIIGRGRVISSERGRKVGTENMTFHKVAAKVELDGAQYDVVATLREDSNGNYHYDLSMDNGAGARGGADRVAEARSTPPAGPGELNLDFAGAVVESDLDMTPADLQAVAAEVNAELARSLPGGQIKARLVRRLVSLATGQDIEGRQAGDTIEVRAGTRYGEVGVLRHEIVHALRQEAFWGKPYGLFMQAEWQELVRMARADKALMQSVQERYPDLAGEKLMEEAVAEMYRGWMAGRDEAAPGARAFMKIRAFFQALANALRGRGFVSAAGVMEKIATGKIGGRGPQGPGGGGRRAARVAEIGRPDAAPRPEMEMRAPVGAVREKFRGLVGSNHWKSPGEWVSSLMTDRITAGDNSLLALVPGRALFAELGKRLPSARVYLRTKEEMDAMRNEWHAKAAEVAGKWHAMQGKDAASNEVMMDLMHRSTLSGIDPSKADTWGQNDTLLRSAEIEYSRHGEAAPDWAKAKIEAKRKREVAYGRLRDIYTSLPPEFQALYREVRDSYDALANDFDKAVESNIKNAARLALKRAEKAHRKELARIRDEKLEGTERDEAIAKADEKLAKVKKRAGMGVNTKIKALRKEFESQRLKGPYFPLARFGNYWVTVRDEDGAVISFSRFEREAQQAAHVREMEAEHPGRVSFGLMADKDNLREQVDPKFVADIETMLAGADASTELMDAIWQRYLETMPDQSIRTSKIHRKGREGWNRDALRAYTSHTFHGAHQLARLQYGMNLEESIEDAYDQARIADDPNRATALVNEMARRKDWTMNPTGAAWSAAASSLAFVWYLGVSPAAALVNITQTTVVGPGLMKARFKKSTVGGIVSELSRAAKDFGKGQGTSWRDLWSVENAPDLTADEKAAIKEGYRRGTIDKTQAHDLAAVAESGVEFSPVREKWMRRIGFAFHHAERFNREITFLANYRLARKEGMDHLDAIEAAADMTWKIHFSYQNSDRPRFMQNDYMKVLTIFRQFQVNLLFRMFRDAHQSLRGASAEDRAEAKTQLIGITLSMMAHAGIKGTWGYGLLMGLLALFFPGDSDDLEEWMQDALLMEGDDPGTAAWNYVMGAVLNGVPGQITGAALTERIGSPNLWFRDLDRDLEGQDLYYHYLSELVGPIGGIGLSLFRAGQNVSDGEIVRGIEGAVPKFVRDVIRMGRYSVEGVTTRNGDPIIEDVSIKELFLQANGFTPARVAERYEINNRLKNREKRVMDERREIQHAAGDAIRSGEPIPERVMEKIRDFNRRFPEYPITGDTLRQSVQSRMRASDRNEFGIQLNPRLNERLRGDLAPALYN